jgi:hypothetical protein
MNTKTWRLRTVAEAAEVKDATLRQWFGIGVLKFRAGDIHSQGTGTHVRVSRLRAYEAAIVQELSLRGVNVSRGAKAAFEFTINGNAARAAGHLFPVGKTIILIKPDSATLENIFSNTSFSEVSAASACVIAVDCNKIVESVDSVLNSIS